MEPWVIILQKLIRAEARRMLDKAREDFPDVGEWRGCYTFKPVSQKRGIYSFDPIETNPLRLFHEKSGFEFRAGPMAETDFGSIPRMFQGIPANLARLNPLTFREAYAFHDFACRNRFLFVRRGRGPWRKMAFTLKMADVFLVWALSAATLDNPPVSATRLEVFLIYRALRTFHGAKGN